MARDVYYQSVGNPLQVDRLESVRSDVHLPYHPFTPAEDARYSIRLIFLFCLLGVACIFAQLMHVEAAHSMVTRSLMWTNIILVGIAAYLVGKSIKERDGWWLGLPLVCLFAAFVFLNVPVTLRVHALLAGVALGVFNWFFGIHWTYQCSTSPMKRKEAEQLRQSWTGYLSLISTVPTIVVAMFLFLPFVLAGSIALVVLSFQIFEACRRSRSVPIYKAWQALVSWLSYNRDDAVIPSIFQSPSGNLRHRITMTGACVLLVSTIYVRLPIELAIRWLSTDTFQSSSFVDDSYDDELEPSPNSYDGVVIAIASIAIALMLPTVATLATPLVLSLPVIAEAARYRRLKVDHSNWSDLIEDLGAQDPNERNSLFYGAVGSRWKSPARTTIGLS